MNHLPTKNCHDPGLNNDQCRLGSASNSDSDSDEAEDEEIKLTCLTGAREYHDSDLETTPDQDDGSDTDDDDDQEEPARDGVVQFVSQRLDMTRSPVVRPHATSPPERPAEAMRSVDRSSECSIDSAGSHERAKMGDRKHDGADGTCDDVLVCTSNTANEGTEVACTDDENEDVELAGILEFLGAGSGPLPVPLPYSDVYEEDGWPECRKGPQQEDWRRGGVDQPKAKRVLSYRTLLNLNKDTGHDEASTKRSKGDDELPSSPFQLVLPLLNLGTPAIPLEAVKQTRAKQTVLSHMGFPHRDRQDSCVSSDEEELDRQLADELDVAHERKSRQNTPVPLLTPPASPLTVDEQVVVCEWPSNLTIDNAMTALLSDIRPTSPQSLEPIEPQEDDDDADERSMPLKATKTSALTPLLRGISVSFE